MKKSVAVLLAVGLPALSLGTLVWTSLQPRARLPATDSPSKSEDPSLSASANFFARQEHPLLDLPPPFSSGDLKDWRAWAVEHKMPHLSFRSSQNQQLRNVFLDQGKDYDRWFLTVAKVEQQDLGNDHFRSVENPDRAKLIGVIVMDKRTRQPQIFFREYRVKDGIIEKEAHPEACYSCHASGLREIRGVSEAQSVMIPGLDPARGTPAQIGAKRISDFNSLMSSYGLPDWHGSYEPEKWYPALGKNSSSRWSCYQCHDGSDRGILTPLNDVTELRRKVMEEKSMPPKFRGARAEREKLWQALAGKTYRKEINQWIKAHPNDAFDRYEFHRFFGENDPED